MVSLLIIVSSDPQVSPRPAEAIRIAAGVGVWKMTEMALLLCDAAVLALGDVVDGLVDDDHFTRYLPIFEEAGHGIYVVAEPPWREALRSSPHRFEEINLEQAAALAAGC